MLIKSVGKNRDRSKDTESLAAFFRRLADEVERRGLVEHMDIDFVWMNEQNIYEGGDISICDPEVLSFGTGSVLALDKVDTGRRSLIITYNLNPSSIFDE